MGLGKPKVPQQSAEDKARIAEQQELLKQENEELKKRELDAEVRRANSGQGIRSLLGGSSLQGFRSGSRGLLS